MRVPGRDFDFRFLLGKYCTECYFHYIVNTVSDSVIGHEIVFKVVIYRGKLLSTLEFLSVYTCIYVLDTGGMMSSTRDYFLKNLDSPPPLRGKRLCNISN